MMSAPVSPQPVSDQWKYKAFISYSHAADDRLAPALQSGLQRFGKPWYRLRSIRVFRDKTGLAVTPELWGSIERALSSSEFFVLLASPQAAGSKWVAQEVEWWLQHRTRDRLLIVLTEGDLTWDAPASDFDWGRTTALSRTLKKRFLQEPNYLDLRWARNETDVSLRQPRFLEAIASLTASLRDRPLDELIGDDVRQHQKTMRLLRIAVLGLVVLTIAALLAALLALQAKRVSGRLASEQESKQKLDSQESLSIRLASHALRAMGTNKLLGILLAAEAVRAAPNNSAESALRGALSQTLVSTVVLRGHSGSLDLCAFSPDGRNVLTGSEDKSARIWDAATGKLLKELHGHTGPVEAGAFANDHRRVWTAGAGSVRYWDLVTGSNLYQLVHPGVTQLEFSSDRRRLLSIADSDAIVWEVGSGRKLAAFEFPPNDAIFPKNASLSPDGNLVVLRDESVREVESGKVVVDELVGHSRRPYTVRFSPDGQSIITASDDHTARIWRTSDGKSLRTLPHGAGVADGLFSPDGQWIATRSDMVRIWDAATGSKRVEIAGPRDPLSAEPDHVFALIFSDNGKCLITLSDNALTADVWETGTGEKLATLTGHTAPIRGASFSPNGRLIVTASLDETAQLYSCDSCGSVDDLLSAARKRAGRELTPQERLSYQIPADKP